MKDYEYELPDGGSEYEISGEDPTELLKKAAAAAQKAARAAAEQTVADYERQKTGLADDLAEADRGAENTYRKAANPYGVREQSVRSAGLSGSGWSESGRIGVANAYQNALSANRSDYAEGIGRLDTAIAQARASGDAKAYEAAAEYAVKLANQLYKQQQDAQAYSYKTSRDAVTDARYADETAYDRAQDAKSYDYKTSRDAVTDSRYADQTAYDRAQDAKSYDYKTSRDAVADSRYAAEWAYKLAKDAADKSDSSGSGIKYWIDDDAYVDENGDTVIANIPPVGVETTDDGYSEAAKQVIGGLIADYYGAPNVKQVLKAISKAGNLTSADANKVLARFNMKVALKNA